MTSKVIYKGELRTASTHLRSGTEIISDAPVDNNGKGEAFSPTDAVATSLATCMLTIMGIMADRKGWNIQGAEATVSKTMASNPRRITKIEVQVQMPKIGYQDNDKELLESVARACPVAKSLHPDIEQVISFSW